MHGIYNVKTDAVRLRNLQLQHSVTGRDRIRFISLLIEIMCSISDRFCGMCLLILCCACQTWSYLCWRRKVYLRTGNLS